MRLTSDFWVSSLLRKVALANGFAYLTRRGAMEAGAIFIIVHQSADSCDLYGPAPQSFYDEDTSNNTHFFAAMAQHLSPQQANDMVEKQLRFDPDIWLVEIENMANQPLPFTIIAG